MITYWEEIKRKLIHLSSLWMVAATLLLGEWSVTVFSILLAITLWAEHAYANGKKVPGVLYGKLFGKMLRTPPRPGQWLVSGGGYVLAAALLVNVLYSQRSAAGGLAVMLIGDAMAALIGRKYGRYRFKNGKSIEGVVAFFVSGLIALNVVGAISHAPSNFFLFSIPAVALGMFIELFTDKLKIDDNFTIPVGVGFILELGVWLMK